jgi:hypothetical protein
MNTLVTTASCPTKMPSPFTKGIPLHSCHSIAASKSANAPGTLPVAKLEYAYFTNSTFFITINFMR